MGGGRPQDLENAFRNLTESGGTALFSGLDGILFRAARHSLPGGVVFFSGWRCILPRAARYSPSDGAVFSPGWRGILFRAARHSLPGGAAFSSGRRASASACVPVSPTTVQTPRQLQARSPPQASEVELVLSKRWSGPSAGTSRDGGSGAQGQSQPQEASGPPSPPPSEGGGGAATTCRDQNDQE